MLFVCHPKILYKRCFQFLSGHFNSQEKLKIMLMQNFGVTNKERYGMLWHFLEWSINELVSLMVFHLNFCPTLVFSLLADWSTLLLSYFSQCRNTALNSHNVLWRKKLNLFFSSFRPSFKFSKVNLALYHSNKQVS